MKGHAVSLSWVLLVFSLTACQVPRDRGESPVYRNETLVAELDHSVKDIADATGRVFSDLGIVPRLSAVSKIEGVIRGQDPEKRTNVKISLVRTPSERTEVTIRVGTRGDEVESQKLLEAIKDHL
jgi:hypothetical protein